MRTRLRGPGGASTITLAEDATIGDLISQITSNTSLTSFDVKYGYPPRPLLLQQYDKSQALSALSVKLDGEQLTISSREEKAVPAKREKEESSPSGTQSASTHKGAAEGFSFTNVAGLPQSEPQASTGESLNKPVSLHRKGMEGDVPELPLPERGATLGSSSSACL